MEKCSDERLDDLNRQVGSGFDRIEANLRGETAALRGEMSALRNELRGEMNTRFAYMDAHFEHLESRFDALNRTMFQLGGGVIVALIGLIATQL